MNKLAFDIDLFDFASEKCFRIEQVLGQNTFETTQLVYISDISGVEHGPYVRKLINNEIGLGAAYSELYKAQARGIITQQLPHIYLLTETNTTLDVVMEYFEGKTLNEAIEDCNTYQERLMLTSRYFSEICQAVNFLHTGFDSPIIHRDLKPSNIMICPDGVKLLDFGIARIYKEGAESDTKHFGTRPYAPPEQYGFGQTDTRSDIYALGKVLYFTLTGKEPSPDARHDLLKHPEISKGLASTIIHATKLDPETRPSNTTELLNELKAALENSYQMLKITEKTNVAASAELNSNTTTRVLTSTNCTPSTYMTDETSLKKESLKHLGKFWNVVLFISALIVVAGAIVAVINPSPENANLPIWYLIYSLFLWLVPCILIVLYLMSDRRPIRIHIPQLSKQSFTKELVTGISVVAGLTLVWALITLTVH